MGEKRRIVDWRLNDREEKDRRRWAGTGFSEANERFIAAGGQLACLRRLSSSSLTCCLFMEDQE